MAISPRTRAPLQRRQRGFTLLELLTVTAIIGTLASVALPSYQRYSDRARFTEALLLVDPYRNAMELAAYRGLATSVNDLDYGKHGIPPIQWGGGNQHYVVPVNGMIYVIWQFDGSPLAGLTYILSAQNIDAPIRWEQSGSCFDRGYC